ncbi:glycoside hydrolase superfamily [Aspergillus venezuelensis]
MHPSLRQNNVGSHPLAAHGITSLGTTDGPAGVRGARWTNGSRTTFIPCGTSLAGVLGVEVGQKRAHVLLVPTMNISRGPFGGRNFEGFGEDPFLTGSLAYDYILGVQSQGVGACMKHFVGNDQETRRFNMDERIDERTLRVIYLRPFEMALHSDLWTAMVAYPKINGAHADCSEVLVNGILREEWGFQGLVMSDWGGLNDTVLSIKASTDLEMPGPAIRYGKALEEAFRDGKVSEEEDINPSVRRVLRTLQRAGRLTAEAGRKNDATVVQREAENSMVGEETVDHPEYRDIAREAAEGGIVLLKNEANILPLHPKKLKKLAILGPNAKTPTAGGSGSAIVNYYVTNPHDSLVKAAQEINPDLEIVYEQSIQIHLPLPLLGDILTTPDGSRQGVQVELYHGHSFEGEAAATTYWQDSMVGIFTPTTSGIYDLSLSNTGQAKFFVNDELLIDNTEWTQICAHFMNCSSVEKTTTMHLNVGEQSKFRIDNVVVPPPTRPHDNTLFHRIAGVKVGLLIQHDQNAMFAKALQTAKNADVVVVVAGHNNDTEREGCDRVSLSLPRQTDGFIQAVAKANSNNVVITQSACAIAMPWADQVSGIIQAWYQGQENGNALADVLLGTVNPSGKLPVTFPKRIDDHGSHKWFPRNPETDQAEYGEGVLVGYLWLDAHNLEPLWSFGFELSYTSFQINDVEVQGNIAVNGIKTARISATVTNTGSVPGKEVVQFTFRLQTQYLEIRR